MDGNVVHSQLTITNSRLKGDGNLLVLGYIWHGLRGHMVPFDVIQSLVSCISISSRLKKFTQPNSPYLGG